MSEIVVGSRVRVRDPHGYIVSVRIKIDKGRVGTVEKLFTPLARRDVLARVTFDARRKGSSSYSDTWPVRDLALVETEAQR